MSRYESILKSISRFVLFIHRPYPSIQNNFLAPQTHDRFHRLIHNKFLQENSKIQGTVIHKPHQSGKAVPLSRLFLISSVYLPKARSIFLLKCSLRSLMESMSFSSWNFLLLLKELLFSSLSLSSFTILSILSSEIFGACQRI